MSTDFKFEKSGTYTIDNFNSKILKNDFYILFVHSDFLSSKTLLTKYNKMYVAGTVYGNGFPLNINIGEQVVQIFGDPTRITSLSIQEVII